MHRKFVRTFGVAALIGGLVVIPMSAAEASQWGGWQSGSGSGPYRASSYINPDTGTATANPNVDPYSRCQNPDRRDTQQVSDPAKTNRNVHNDACLFGNNTSGLTVDGERVFDGQATFESTGVGVISGCPDPDGAGPKTATLSLDKKRCTQTGYQVKGTAGDGEFHARMNNDNRNNLGEQKVTFCYDPEGNGCADANIKSDISIAWQATDPGTRDGRDGSSYRR